MDVQPMCGRVLVLGLACAAAVACKPVAPTANVVLITVDTLRPDSLGFIGGRTETPSMDGLAAGGYASSGALSPTPLTLPSHTSILSGRLPRKKAGEIERVATARAEYERVRAPAAPASQ